MNSTVEITLEFDERPNKKAIYTLLISLIEEDVLRYDIDGELDSQLKEDKL